NAALSTPIERRSMTDGSRTPPSHEDGEAQKLRKNPERQQTLNLMFSFLPILKKIIYFAHRTTKAEWRPYKSPFLFFWRACAGLLQRRRLRF
ncbi:hypothetical protein, partial [Neomegalonema sp.]|uniref:hypothetical protein n=1 Tax=Neomegalonema sp. TaxID=2039713 RepID=UPI002635C9C6